MNHAPAVRWLLVLSSAVVTAALTLHSAPAHAYQSVHDFAQEEVRDANGKVTVEASIIHVIQCNAEGENGGQFYIYQFTDRAGFRAIQPPAWGSPIGGKDFDTFDEAATAACLPVPVDTPD
ncbi:MAG: hypothetical protein Q8P41_04700 [Pseudomonadota bacterium]|nr:hypothetical protein [Pseudomonadota bacterium]